MPSLEQEFCSHDVSWAFRHDVSASPDENSDEIHYKVEIHGSRAVLHTRSTKKSDFFTVYFPIVIENSQNIILLLKSQTYLLAFHVVSSRVLLG